MVKLAVLHRLMTAANYAMKLEREVWGVLDGPWGSDTWMGWRRDWAQKASSHIMCSDLE